MAQMPRSKSSRWADRLTRSGFFFGALLFHLVVFLAVATYIVWPAPPATPPSKVVYTEPSPPQITPPSTTQNVALVTPAPPASNVAVVTTPHGMISFPVDFPNVLVKGDNQGPQLPHPGKISSGPDIRMQNIRATILKKWHMTPQQILDHDPTCTFPVYVAAYANGDWGCNTRLDAHGNIFAGSMPDLVAKINEWSHGSIKGEVVPKPLDVGSPELLDKMPPFIFFTGHKDFVLTDREIANLSEYLNNGGAIWGDNAMAGAGSRFDVAFHREMKRVVPDLDKNFVPYTLDGAIFTGSRYPIDEVPSGMNYYAEFPQHLDIDGSLAIIYTPNDYSDILFMRLLPEDDKPYAPPPEQLPPDTLYTNYDFWSQRDTFYRNFRSRERARSASPGHEHRPVPAHPLRRQAAVGTVEIELRASVSGNVFRS